MVDNVTSPIPTSTVFKSKLTATNGHMMARVSYDSAEAEVFGLVTASPAANTVLGRLKDLLSLIVLAAGSNIIGKVGIDQTTPGTTNKVWLTDISDGEFENVLASVSTPQTIGGTGAVGDYISHVLVIPETTSPGAVTLYDGSTSPDVGFIIFTGGASSVSNLVPFTIPLANKSVVGAWKITTGANVHVRAVGNFT